MFLRHVSSIGFPPADGEAIRFPVRSIKRHLAYRMIGSTWFVDRYNIGLLVFSSALLVLGVLRSVETGQPSEFPRAGAIVVIAGLLSTMNAAREVRTIRARWEQVGNNTTRDNLKKSVQNILGLPMEFAERKAAKFSLALTLIGTVVWAYGDQFLGCTFTNTFSDSCDLNP